MFGKDTDKSELHAKDRKCRLSSGNVCYYSDYFISSFPFVCCNRVWRKKNACFSNNCNFVYFQYKTIMLTPEQPVINAILIIYIDYSIAENYIGKMASFLPYTRPEPLLKVLQHIY